jgi:hypothetical protein
LAFARDLGPRRCRRRRGKRLSLLLASTGGIGVVGRGGRGCGGGVAGAATAATRQHDAHHQLAQNQDVAAFFVGKTLHDQFSNSVGYWRMPQTVESPGRVVSATSVVP